MINPTNKKLIKLFKPCEQLCKDCGAICCRNQETGKMCEALKDGQCTKRNWFCLMHYCEKIEKNFPKIIIEVNKISKEMFPYADSLGIHPDFKWKGL